MCPCSPHSTPLRQLTSLAGVAPSSPSEDRGERLTKCPECCQMWRVGRAQPGAVAPGLRAGGTLLLEPPPSCVLCGTLGRGELGYRGQVDSWRLHEQRPESEPAAARSLWPCARAPPEPSMVQNLRSQTCLAARPWSRPATTTSPPLRKKLSFLRAA